MCVLALNCSYIRVIYRPLVPPSRTIRRNSCPTAGRSIKYMYSLRGYGETKQQQQQWVKFPSCITHPLTHTYIYKFYTELAGWPLWFIKDLICYHHCAAVCNSIFLYGCLSWPDVSMSARSIIMARIRVRYLCLYSLINVFKRSWGNPLLSINLLLSTPAAAAFLLPAFARMVVCASQTSSDRLFRVMCLLSVLSSVCPRVRFPHSLPCCCGTFREWVTIDKRAGSQVSLDEFVRVKL